MKPLKTKAFLCVPGFFLALIALAHENPIMPNKATSPELMAAYRSKGPDYVPRTRHLKADGSPKYINRLILESSPYLLQHAHNPVDWRPWSAEAFALAKAQNKPIFLSIGYSTCHWCHVMEEESFEDPDVAALLNTHFIPVKVDREEHPAVDDYYMTAVQMLTGHGGWPMSTFLTPEGKPFFGGTYYPTTAFMQLLKRVAEVWHQQPGALRTQADELNRAITRYLSTEKSGQEITATASHDAVDQLLRMHDEIQGGFGTAPKFPQETWLVFLQDMWARSGDENIEQALENTLSAMQQGGINDQVGGGFHRYATDPAWLIPHFEKMAYNQAQLASVYTRAWLHHGKAEDKRTATRILNYLLRDMQSPQGAFYSASDADSLNASGERQEGAYFTWSLEEFRQALSGLPKSTQKMAEAIYQVRAKGHFEGRNILHRRKSLPELAREFSLPWPEFVETLDRINRLLLEARNQRPGPLVDRKIITAWNAHAIRALALAGQHFHSADFLDAAKRAARYLWEKHRHVNGRALIRSSLADKPSSLSAYLEDHAQFILALLALFDATGNAQWLEMAETLYSEIPAHLVAGNGGFYDNLSEPGIPWQQRLQKSEDGATPSGQALMLQALVKLWHRTGTLAYRHRFQQATQAIAGKVAQSPLSHASALLAHHWMNEGEISPIAYAGGGRIRLQAERTGADSFSLNVQLAPGWHVTAHDDAGTQAFKVTTTPVHKVLLHALDWPASSSQRLNFQEDSLKTWQGTVRITGRLTLATRGKPGKKTTGTWVEHEHVAGFPVTVSLQACNQRICLPPEKLSVWVPADASRQQKTSTPR